MWTVYKIASRFNGRKYIGCTSRTIERRFKTHISDLCKGTHCNINLQKDFLRGHWFDVSPIRKFSNKLKAIRFENSLVNQSTYNKMGQGHPIKYKTEDLKVGESRKFSNTTTMKVLNSANSLAQRRGWKRAFECYTENGHVIIVRTK